VESPSNDVTLLLGAIRNGDAEARGRLAALLYPQLRRLAQALMRGERSDHTLQPTALVHEAYMRVFGNGVECVNRAHFLAVAAQVMRQVLVDYARQKRALKRGGDFQRVELDFAGAGADLRGPDFHIETLLTLDTALARLEEWDERQSRVVEMRFFGGLSEEEIAAALGVSVRTIKRDWNLAKAWLYSELGK